MHAQRVRLPIILCVWRETRHNQLVGCVVACAWEMAWCMGNGGVGAETYAGRWTQVLDKACLPVQGNLRGVAQAAHQLQFSHKEPLTCWQLLYKKQ